MPLTPPPPQIAESLSRFGVNEGCPALLLAAFDASPQDLAALRALVAGRQAPLTQLASLADQGLLTKYYKVDSRPHAGPRRLRWGRLPHTRVVLGWGAAVAGPAGLAPRHKRAPPPFWRHRRRWRPPSCGWAAWGTRSWRASPRATARRRCRAPPHAPPQCPGMLLLPPAHC